MGLEREPTACYRPLAEQGHAESDDKQGEPTLREAPVLIRLAWLLWGSNGVGVDSGPGTSQGGRARFPLAANRWTLTELTSTLDVEKRLAAAAVVDLERNESVEAVRATQARLITMLALKRYRRYH